MTMPPVMPKGRTTIRREVNTSMPGNPMVPVGRANKRIPLWELAAQPGTTIAKLEKAYLDSLAAVDGLAGHKSAAAKSGKFTPEGLQDDLRQAALNLTPTFKRGRT